jgi:type II secretory pathway pseudopilin PulG
MIKLKSQNKKGFTLIELLVASAIFIVVSMVVVSIFLIAIRNQRRDFQVQNLQDNARYMIESFSKETRMLSQIQSWSSTQLQILNQDNEVVTYRFRNGNLERNGQPINSDDVTIQGAFSVVTTGQPMVTIAMTFSPKVSPTGTSPGNITVQNTIAVRIY